MTDLHTRFAELDRIAAPDLWPEIERRAAEPERVRASVRRRVGQRGTRSFGRVAGLVALTVLTGGAVYLAAQPSPSPEPAIVWDSGSVRLEANALEIRAGDEVFRGQEPYSVRSATGDPQRRTLEVEWVEDGIEQRLFMYFAADDLDWWVTEIRTRDGHRQSPDWLSYDELDYLFATPRGEAYIGDLHLRGGRSDREGRPDGGQLSFEGLRLAAFMPGTGAAPLSDCEHVRVSAREGQAEPLDKGQPLAGTGIEEMSPTEAEALLHEMGLCFTFRYVYRTSEGDAGEGYSERWCTAPPAGEIVSISYLEDGEVVVLASDQQVLPLRDQPLEGWNCVAE